MLPMVKHTPCSFGSPHHGPVSSHWGPHADYLLTVERSELWRAHARSMTQWMRAYATHIGRSMPALWRYKNSGQFYERKQQALALQGVSLPPLAEMPDSVSAETLELLEKVERVVPRWKMEEMQLSVLQGQATRREVTKVWKLYRVLLEGKSARGYGVERPHADPAKEIKLHCLLNLTKNVREIMQREGGKFTILVADVLDAPSFFAGIDLLGLEPTVDQIVTVHAFEICDFTSKPEFGQFGIQRATNRNVHYWWVVSPDPVTQKQLRLVAPGVGVIVTNAAEFAVLREPTALIREYTDGEAFISKLLLHAMKASY